MPLSRRQWLTGTAAVLIGSAFSSQLRAQTSALTPSQILDDLLFLQNEWAPLDRSFSPEQRRTFDGIVADAIAAADKSSLEDLAMTVMKAVAVARNGHTAAFTGNLIGNLPIRAWWFSDGLYVVSAHPRHADLLGARIEKFGALTAEEALMAVAPYISGTEQRIRYLSAAYLTRPAVLRRILGAAQEQDFPLTVRFFDGTVATVNLASTEIPDAAEMGDPFHQGWYALIPHDRQMPGRWPHVLDSVDALSPTYAKPASFSMQWLGEGEQAFYIRSNRIEDEGEYTLEESLLFGALQFEVVAKRPRTVIVDLRMNNGGDFFHTLLFAQALPKVMLPGGRVFVLISRATFSAALTTAAVLKGSGPDNVTLIGEPMGDSGQFWSEGQTLDLPNSGIPVNYTTRFGDFENGCSDSDDCYWPVTAFGPRGISLAPEIRIDVTFAEYASGADPVLDAALALGTA